MRTTWKWVALVGALVVVIACYLWWSARGHAPPGDGQRSNTDPEHLKQCEANHPPFPRPKLTVQHAAADRAPATATRASVQPLAAAALPLLRIAPGGGGDCPDSGCGLNGTWLGAGVPFRTLHLSRFRHNDVNLSILGFRGPRPAGGGEGERLTLAVDGDVLHAEGRPIVEAGSELLLGAPEVPGGPPSTPTYKLTITKVHDADFWIQNDCPACAAEKFPVYVFSATSLSDDCPVQVCAPGLDADSDRTNNLIGTAVIFRGDYYDESYTVRIAPPTDYDDDVFNIACAGTTLSKLHRLRHTTAAKVTAADPPAPPVDRRQALLRMLTADYCGAGHPFTHDGVPLHFGFDPALGFGNRGNPNPPVVLTAASQYRLTPFGPTSLEAMWTGDGAACIAAPRLLGERPGVMADIEAACRLVGHPVVACPGGLTGTITAPYPVPSYLISQNP